MKKILLGLAVIVFCTNLSSSAAEGYVFTDSDYKPVYSQSLQITNLPSGKYLKYYNINTEKIGAGFVHLSKAEEKNFLKTLAKEEQENYKYVKKIQKIISNGDWNKVFTKYPNFLPAYLQYYDINYSKGNYTEALSTLQQIKNLDTKSQIFNPDLMNYSFGILYFSIGQYTTALNYFKMYENSGDDFITSSLANCYYSLGNYTLAIEYCMKLKKTEYKDKELLYSAYYNLKNYTQANKYALELLKENYNYVNLMKVQASSSNNNTKLSYCYKARELALGDNEIFEVNEIISNLEQKKLDAAISSFTQFVKVPKWSDIEKQIPENVPAVEISKKQDEFFKSANLYLTKYKGQQLTNAFNSLNQDYNNYVQVKQNQYYQEKQIQAQQALVEEQQRNNELQQEILKEQQMRNYLERQNYYYMSRPYYYMGPRYHGWW